MCNFDGFLENLRMKKLFTVDSKYHGQCVPVFSWQPEGIFLATAGNDGLVHIFGRHGEHIEEIALNSPGMVHSLEWDKDGQTLAILQIGNTAIPLWDLASRSIQFLDTAMKDLSFISWSKVGPQLAIGTAKGNLLIYNKSTRKKIPVMAKHPKKITCGAWNSENQLILGSEDKIITLSNHQGDTIQQTEVKYPPLDMQFGATKPKGPPNSTPLTESIITVNMGGRSLLLYDINDPENPIELAFQQRYGSIARYFWYGDGYLMIGFSEGFLVVISTHPEEIGEELFSGKFHKERLNTIAYSPTLQRTAVSGDSGIKLVDMSNWNEAKSESVPHSTIEEGEGINMAFTNDGQIFTVATRGGVVHNFLSKMPNINDSCNTSIAYLTSLREIAIVETQSDPMVPRLVTVSIEPSFIALGPNHVAVGMNNRVWYYSFGDKVEGLVNEQEYLGAVESVHLNHSYAAVLFNNKIALHSIEPQENQQRKIFPFREDKSQEITDLALTNDFLIYSTSVGSLEFFHLSEWSMLSGSEYRHDQGILNIYPNPRGTRVLFMDSLQTAYLYNPINSHSLVIPNLPNNVRKFMWDSFDWGCFVSVSPDEIGVHLYSSLTIYGEKIIKLGQLEILENGDFTVIPQPTPLPLGYNPILVHNGELTCQQPNGAIVKMGLKTHEIIHLTGRSFEGKESEAFNQNLALLRFQKAWELASMINQHSHWLALGGKAMEHLNVQMAIRVYRHLGDAGMVMGLENVMHIEDKSLLAGHILMLFGEYSEAQELLLVSSNPKAAVEMRRDLLHWDQALKLALTLAPDQVPELSLEYARQLEFKGSWEQALKMYENALNSLEEKESLNPIHTKEHQKACLSGIARTSLRMGDLRRGFKLAVESKDNTLCKECGAILETMKQFPDAALVYEKGEQYEKAATIYINNKMLTKAAPLMKYITTPKVHSQYARAKEALNEYEAAVEAYEAAQDMESVIRILLDSLNHPEKAFSLARKTQTAEGSHLVAKYCLKTGNYQGAIEFLLLSNRSVEAYEVAITHNEMNMYTKILGDMITPEDANRVAKYYETNSDLGRAGEFYSLCGNYQRALKLFLQCGENELHRAIEVVGKARSDMLTHTLIDFLMGENDGVPKDPNFIFRLYMALGNYTQAAKTALIIARQEQELGNYKIAHGVLVETYRQLHLSKIRVPQALRRSLLLLHSYILVKKMVKREDHVGAARMLVRIGKNISKFPSHVVNILTSIVIECQRAGLKGKSYEYAAILMRPEYRGQIEQKFKRKIEAIVRRPNKEEEDEPVTPCPYCSTLLEETLLDCPNCKNSIAYCVITGRHMVKDNWSNCPKCEFPALYQELLKVIETDSACPMCDQVIVKSDVKLLEGKAIDLNYYMKDPEESNPEGETDDF